MFKDSLWVSHTAPRSGWIPIPRSGQAVKQPLCQDRAHPTVPSTLGQGRAHRAPQTGPALHGGTGGQPGAARSQGPSTARPLIPHGTSWVSQPSEPALCTQNLSEDTLRLLLPSAPTEPRASLQPAAAPALPSPRQGSGQGAAPLFPLRGCVVLLLIKQHWGENSFCFRLLTHH